ncbi:MAG: nucleotidyltransferase domain-containing protein [Nanoarchaeota archaeon]|nr:nucleotidyltransferase domain-containing protein [Nanoarchaeota archaeon]MBU1854432.1 nucleotidyltransferase domain-containing protein [Nanoarchaeota archaeon]
MLEDITFIDLKILSLFTKDYLINYSIREMTLKLGLNYSHTFKRINNLVKQNILIKHKHGQANRITLNIQNLNTVQLISFVEEQESQKLNNPNLKLIAQEAILTDPFACIGLFGSRVSGKVSKESDWDVFIITQKRKEIEKIVSKFPHIENIQLQVFSLDEFQESILSTEETVVKHILRNKQIIYNSHPFYNIIYKWEKIKNAPSQTN